MPLPSSLPGWWAKIGLFRPGLFTGDVLYLDLDVILTRDLFGMVDLLDRDRSTLWAPDDFSYSVLNPGQNLGAETQRLLGGPATINSSVMMWHGDTCRKIWDNFTINKMDECHGDQNVISQTLWPNINLIPHEWVKSFKYHGMGPVTVFHGNQKPPDVHAQWVTEHWR